MPTATQERVIFYRQSRLYEEEPIRVDEISVRSSILAWRTTVDSDIEKMKAGKRVVTPYAYYYAKIV